jgi:hypothetical protein
MVFRERTVLPDFPRVKQHVQRLVLRLTEARIPQLEPLLATPQRYRQHEGRDGLVERPDQSGDATDFKLASSSMEVPREEMRSGTLDQILRRSFQMAADIGGQQVKTMLETVSAAIDATGNTVDGTQDPKAAWLEMERRAFVDFDPETLQPIGQVLVIHPSQAEMWKRRSEEWEKDPAFVAAREAVRVTKLEEWRARENSRKLVD